MNERWKHLLPPPPFRITCRRKLTWFTPRTFLHLPSLEQKHDCTSRTTLTISTTPAKEQKQKGRTLQGYDHFAVLGQWSTGYNTVGLRAHPLAPPPHPHPLASSRREGMEHNMTCLSAPKCQQRSRLRNRMLLQFCVGWGTPVATRNTKRQPFLFLSSITTPDHYQA